MTTEHVLVLNPPRRLRFWCPWSCICGAGGTGVDEAGATHQYELHVQGLWPALIEPAADFTEAHIVDGRTIWCRPRKD